MLFRSLYNYNFDIAAILLNAMLLLVVYIRRTYPSRPCTLYKWMLWFNLAASVADLVSASTISFPFSVSLVTNYFINICYLFFHNVTAVIFLVYVITIIRGNAGTKGERIFWKSAIAVVAALTVTTPLTHFVFYFDQNRMYQHGPLIYALYIITFAVLFYALYLFVRHRNAMTGFQLTTDIVFLALMIAAVVFQFFRPDILIEPYCAAVSFLMLNVALDNPAMYFYRNTTCYNNTAFLSMLEDRIAAGEKFSVVAFTYDDLSVFRDKWGDEAYDNMINHTIAVCHQLYGQGHVYMNEDVAFGIEIGEQNPEEAIEKLRPMLGKSILVEGKKHISLAPHFCIFRHPGVAANAGDVVSLLTDALFDVYTRTGQRVIEATADLLEKRRREAKIVHMLHDALRRDGFEVYYQPILEQRTGKFVSAEALLRLKRNSLRVGPDEFIPAAEKNGLVLDIGEIVFEKVCRFWRDNKLAEHGVKYMEVNLSILQLMQKRAAERLFDICTRYGVPPTCINFEITETTTATAGEKATIDDCIAYLRSKGFTFSLDDYGSGYSTVTYLAEMPFDIVKIDKNILWNAVKQPNFRIILDNSIRLARQFGRQCVVEGVETEEMAQLLRELGCDYFQGYLYSRPVNGDDYLAFLDTAAQKEPESDR